MSDIDFGLLRGQENAGGEPPDGQRAAMLVRADIVDTSKGSMLITEWQTSGGPTPYYWQTWFGFTPTRISVTQELLDGLGIDRASVTDDDAFEAQLHAVTGRTYTVTTSRWANGVNTYIDERSPTRPQSEELPIDTAGVPAAAVAAAGTNQTVDDDIPF